MGVIRLKIGIFDSGIGGLSVLPALKRALPSADVLYYADEKNVPYGEKSPEEILVFSMNAVDFLVSEGARAVIVACNTATSVAINRLREKYECGDTPIPIVGMEPAVKPAVTLGSGRVLVAATPVTVRGSKLKALIERFDKKRVTDPLPLPGLVRLAEGELFGTAEADDYIKKELSRFDLSKYSSLVLGCTHFNYFKDSFKRILPDGTAIVDGVDGTVRRLVSRLGGTDIGGNGNIDFFISGERANDYDRFYRLLARLEEMERID